jgi:thymidylate kinase
MLRYIRNIIKNIFADNNICILGIDGTGKTSITNELKRILGENAEIQYMGSKDYITGLAQKRLDLENGSKHAASRMINLIAALIEIWYRVIRHWPSSKTIIYDRYAWERYIFLYGIERTFGKILYRALFPKPRHVFYLYCPAELSFSRKSDILDKKEFIERKKCYDTEFMGDKHITAINTAVNSMDSIVHIISNAYMKKHS